MTQGWGNANLPPEAIQSEAILPHAFKPEAILTDAFMSEAAFCLMPVGDLTPNIVFPKS